MLVCTDSVLSGHTYSGESRMLPGIVKWLREMRWIRQDSLLVQELPINGRRVDLAIMTNSGVLSSFELKLSGFARVLEQASYNQLSFDKSWVVVGGNPRADNLASANRFGIGVIVFNSESPRILLSPGKPNTDMNLRSRLQERMMRIEVESVQQV